MPDVLSQSQIDALMKEMRSGGKTAEKKESTPEKKYRKYDFYSPKKITKERIRLLSGIYENYSRIASSRLNGVLRVNSEITVLYVEEQRFYEFSNALGENDILMTQDLLLPNGSKNPPILLHISQVPMLAMMDRMLGGDGSDLGNVNSSYVYTDLEMELYRKIMGYFLDFTKDAWSGYIHLECGDSFLEENPGLFQKISLDETVAIISLNVKVGQAEGKLNVCIPRTLLTEIFSIIDSRAHVSDGADGQKADSREFILSKIKDSALTVRVGLGKTQADIRDIRGLKVGDVISLSKPKDSSVYVDIGGSTWLEGTLGVYKNDSAVLVDGRPGTQKEAEETAPAE